MNQYKKEDEELDVFEPSEEEPAAPRPYNANQPGLQQEDFDEER